MPRGLFDRLTDHDDAPRCRYDEHTGFAEFVAEPGFAHEGPASRITQLFGRIADALADDGSEVLWASAGALRLISDDGAFEADASLYLDPEAERAVRPGRRVPRRQGGPAAARSRRRDRPQPPVGLQARPLLPDGRQGGVDVTSEGRCRHLDTRCGCRRGLPVGRGQRRPPGADRTPTSPPSAPAVTRESRPVIPGVLPAASPSECSMPPAPDGRRGPVGERHPATLDEAARGLGVLPAAGAARRGPLPAPDRRGPSADSRPRRMGMRPAYRRVVAWRARRVMSGGGGLGGVPGGACGECVISRQWPRGAGDAQPSAAGPMGGHNRTPSTPRAGSPLAGNTR